MDIFPVIRFSFSLYKKILWIIFVPAIPSTIRNIMNFYSDCYTPISTIEIREKEIDSIFQSVNKFYFSKRKRKDFGSKHRKRNARYQTAWWINRLTPFPWLARSWNKSRQAGNSCLPFFPTSASFIVCVGPAFTISKGRMLVMQKWNADEVVIAEGLGKMGEIKRASR